MSLTLNNFWCHHSHFHLNCIKEKITPSNQLNHTIEENSLIFHLILLVFSLHFSFYLTHFLLPLLSQIIRLLSLPAFSSRCSLYFSLHFSLYLLSISFPIFLLSLSTFSLHMLSLLYYQLSVHLLFHFAFSLFSISTSSSTLSPFFLSTLSTMKGELTKWLRKWNDE